MKFKNYMNLKKMNAIFVGRMQPISIAHWKIIKEAERKYKKVYVIVVEGITSSKNEKNFLSFVDRQDILKVTGVKAKLILSTVGYLPDVIANNNIDTSKGIAIIAGTDRMPGYKRQFVGLDYYVKFDEIKRTHASVSATKIRQAIENSDFVEYKKMIAPGLDNNKWFDLFKRAMLLKKNEHKINKGSLLLEDVNTHIEHMEDLLFINNVSGIEKTMGYIKSVVSALSHGSGATIKTKFDGCIHPDTIILTNDGDVKIKDMIGKMGIQVLTHNIDGNRNEYNEAINPRINNNYKNWVEVYFENGEKAIVTEDHEFYTTNRGWMKAIDLKEDDDIKEQQC